MTAQVVAAIYAVIGIASAAFIWNDAEFRQIDRITFAILGLLVWPIALPWYLVARPESLVQDKTYNQSHQHYKDFLKTKGKDLGEGLEEALKHSEEAMAHKKALELRQDMGDDDKPVTQVVIGGSPATEAGWGNLEGGKPAARTSYGSNTEMMQSVRSKLYGDEGTAFADSTAPGTAPPLDPALGWNLGTPSAPAPSTPPPPPAPSAPGPTGPLAGGGWNVSTPAKPATPVPPDRPTNFRLRLYGDDPVAEAPKEDETVSAQVDKHLEHLMGDGQLREALQIAQRLMDRTARAGDSRKQSMYQRYVLEIEQKLQDQTLVDD
ncbi:MAG: hypothetical protein ABI743_00295 [bacterium]